MAEESNPRPSSPVTPSRWALRREFTRLLVLAAILPALVFGVLQIWSQYQTERSQLGERMAITARLTAASIDEFIDAHVAGLALLTDVRAPGSDDWTADLAHLHSRYPLFLTLLATDRNGTIHAVHPPARRPPGPARNVADRAYFRVPARTGKPYVSNAFRGRGMGTEPLVAISAPLRREGAFDGVVEGSVRVDTIAGSHALPLRQRGYEFLLVDRIGQVIYASSGLPYRFLQPVGGTSFMASRTRSRHDLGGAQRHAAVLSDGSAAFVAQSQMQSGWTLLLFAPETQVVGAARERALAMSVLLVLVTLGVIAASWRQMRLLAGSMQRLLEALQGVALGGSLDTRRIRRMPEELQPLALAISDLSSRLNRAYTELSEALNRQRDLADSLHGVVTQREQEIAARTAQLRQAVAELDRLNRTDPLTGCSNLRGLREMLATLGGASCPSQSPYAVLAIDVDHFKAFNDCYGHPAGDNALKQIVGAIHSALRGVDDEVARVGGEEFVALLPGADMATALAVAERIHEHVRAADITHDCADSHVLTISIGVAIADPKDEPELVLQRADSALYRAKRGGRDRVST